MLTALSDEESRIKGLSLGADDYLVKPFSLKELQLKVRKCLDQQRTIKALVAKEQEQDTSLRYLVHELRNSLSIIGNFSALALKKEEHAPKYLKTISAASSHAENLLNDTSLLTRLEQDDFSFPITPVNIAELTEEVADLFRDEARSRAIDIVIENTTRLTVKGYRTAVRQVLVNLISNAVKYNSNGGTVWISFDDQGPCLRVSIRDKGCGVSREEFSRIFDKFYRAAGSERKKGAGLGLFIVKLLMEAMGGEVSVASDVGVGSVFTVSFQNYEPAGCKEGAQIGDE